MKIKDKYLKQIKDDLFLKNVQNLYVRRVNTSNINKYRKFK